MSETPAARCEVSLTSRVSASLTAHLAGRFARVSTTDDGSGLVVEGLDQAGVRGLLTCLWDAGAEVRSVTVLPSTLRGSRKPSEEHR